MSKHSNRNLLQRKTNFRLFGGLGNQLFILAAGRYLEEKFSHRVVYNTWYLERFGENHGCTLEHRGFSDSFRRTSPPLPNLSKAVSRRLRWADRVYIPKFGLGWDPELGSVSRGRTVNGYFQSWRYPAALDKSISRDAILLQSGTSAWFEERRAAAIHDRPLIAHVRRGDYEGLASEFGLVGRDYYSKAIRYARSVGMDNDIWVVSDDPSAAASVLGSANLVAHFLQPPSGNDPGESLALMAYGGANIISNSTFAWWGAFLNPGANLVIAPCPWFRGLPAPSHLLPTHWTSLSHRFEDR